MTWHLACRDCAKGMEIKNIGCFWTSDVCEVCGKTVPRYPLNNTPAGYPLTEEQFAQVRAARSELEGVQERDISRGSSE
jgi:hypothetical protein